jgi:RNA polymerase sigma-70 factor, ECF subfamily
MAQTDEVGGTAEEPAVVSAMRSGGADAFSSLTEPYRRELRAHCYRMVGNLEDAEDLVQDTLLRAWRSRSGFEGRSSLRAWLYRIATNVCLDAINRTRRRVRVLDAPPGPGGRPRSMRCRGSSRSRIACWRTRCRAGRNPRPPW